jgi:uncharacterized protein (DUF1330 family)
VIIKECAMKKSLLYAVSLVGVFALGHLSARSAGTVAYAQDKPERAAYLIAATSPTPAAPEKMAKYAAAAGPLARQAGMQLLAGAVPGQPTFELLEGTFPYQGRVAIEKFRSMKALHEFWHSEAYQTAKKNRTDANFIIAIEASE